MREHLRRKLTQQPTPGATHRVTDALNTEHPKSQDTSSGSIPTGDPTRRHRHAMPPAPDSDVHGRCLRPSLTTDSHIGNSPRGGLRAINFAAFARPTPGNASRAVSSPRQATGMVDQPRSDPGAPPSEGRSAAPSRCRGMPASPSSGPAPTGRSLRLDPRGTGPPPRPLPGTRPGVEVRTHVGIIAQMRATVILRQRQGRGSIRRTRGWSATAMSHPAPSHPRPRRTGDRQPAAIRPTSTLSCKKTRHNRSLNLSRRCGGAK